MIQQRAEAEVPLEEVLESWAVGTDPSVHVAKLTELFDSRATIVNVHCARPDQKAVLENSTARTSCRLSDHAAPETGEGIERLVSFIRVGKPLMATRMILENLRLSRELALLEDIPATKSV